MGRDIKFRAYYKIYKSIYPVAEIILDEESVMLITTDEHDGELDMITCGYEDIEIMQCTGLKTRSGVELYEGDICTQKRLGKDVVFEIIFRWGMFMAKIKHVEFVLKTACENDYNHNLPIKVIGNIYQNKELLNT